MKYDLSTLRETATMDKIRRNAENQAFNGRATTVYGINTGAFSHADAARAINRHSRVLDYAKKKGFKPPKTL